MITYEELFITILYVVILAIVLYFVYKMIINSKELKYKNLSISKIKKDIEKRLKRNSKKCQKK